MQSIIARSVNFNNFTVSDTYNQIADKNLKDLGLEAGSTGKHSLEDANENVAKRSTDKSTIHGHLRYSRGEVVAMYVPILSDPRGEKFLKAGQCSSCKHLCPQRVLLELLEVCLLGTSICAAKHLEIGELTAK